MKTTRYFDATRERPDRASIRLEWIEGVMRRIVLLADGETVHNAFFDRGFTP